MPTPASDSTTIVLLLAATLGAESATAVPLTPKPYFQVSEWLHKQQLAPSALLDPTHLAALATDCQLELPRLEALLDRGAALALSLERWASQGIWVLSRHDAAYPTLVRQRLRHQAPPLLFGAGDPELLKQPGIAVVGSREADEPALAFARGIGEAAAQQGFVIISGSARGIDREAMGSTIEAEGQAIGVLGDGLAKQAVQRETRQWLRGGTLTLVTPYAPEAGHNVGNLMGRNKLIYALAQAAVVAHTKAGSGGTWTGATETLEAGWVPVWFWADDAAPKANFKLERLGAQPVTTAELADLAQLLQAPSTASPPAVESPAPEPAAETPPDLFTAVWPLIAAFLAEPRTDKALREAFPELTPKALKSWLTRAESEGRLGKLKRPVRWALKAATPEPIDEHAPGIQLSLLGAAK